MIGIRHTPSRKKGKEYWAGLPVVPQTCSPPSACIRALGLPGGLHHLGVLLVGLSIGLVQWEEWEEMGGLKERKVGMLPSQQVLLDSFSSWFSTHWVTLISYLVPSALGGSNSCFITGYPHQFLILFTSLVLPPVVPSLASLHLNNMWWILFSAGILMGTGAHQQ